MSNPRIGIGWQYYTRLRAVQAAVLVCVTHLLSFRPHRRGRDFLSSTLTRSGSTRRDGLILAIVAAVTLIPGGVVVASQLGGFLSDELEGYGRNFDPRCPSPGDEALIPDGHLVVAFYRGEFGRLDTPVIWGEDTALTARPPLDEATLQSSTAAPTRTQPLWAQCDDRSDCSSWRRELTLVSRAETNLAKKAR